MGRIKKKIQRFGLFLSDFKPILLSHHPNCEKFQDHVYHMGKHKLCIGCFTFYPTVLITIIITILFIELSLYNIFLLFFIAHLFFIPIILNILGLTKYKILKILSKVSIGIGVGLYIVSILLIPFIHIIIKILLLLQINWYLGVIAYIRNKHIIKKCAECEYKGDWSSCPAMKTIVENLYEHGFKVKKNITHQQNNI